MSKNERKTENVVREELRRLGFYDLAADIQVEEQKSNIDAVKRLLKAGSKSGGGGLAHLSSSLVPSVRLIFCWLLSAKLM